MKDQLNFDVTDADTIAESDSVGAYIRSSDGTLITHSTVGGKEALDVSIADGVNVEVDLSHVDDSVRLGDGTSFFTSTSENGDIALDVHMSNSSIVVTATDLDIRDITHVSDSIKIGDGVEFAAVNVSNELQVRDDDANTALGTIDAVLDSIKVDTAAMVVDLAAIEVEQLAQGVTLDSILVDTSIIAGDTTSMDATLTALSKAEDSIHASGDQGIMGLAVRNDTLAPLAGTDGDYAPLQVDALGAAYVNVSNTISINDVALADTAIISTAKTLGVVTVAETAVSAAQTSRKYLFIYNDDNRKMYVGGSGVTAANGFPVSPGSYMELRAGENSAVYFNSPKLHKIRTLELS